MTDTHVDASYRIWRSGDDLLLVIADVGEIELSRDEALALAAEISQHYAQAPDGKRRANLTEAERAEVCRLYQEDGIGVAALSRRLNMQPQTIYQILHRAGTPKHNPKTAERMKRLRALRVA